MPTRQGKDEWAGNCDPRENVLCAEEGRKHARNPWKAMSKWTDLCSVACGVC